MLVGPHPASLSAGEWRSEDDLPRPFFPGVVSRGGARRVATERKKEVLALGVGLGTLRFVPKVDMPVALLAWCWRSMLGLHP